MINGKDSGLIETVYEWAKQYWDKRATVTGFKIKLQPIAQSLDVELIKRQSAISKRLAGNEIKFDN